MGNKHKGNMGHDMTNTIYCAQALQHAPADLGRFCHQKRLGFNHKKKYIYITKKLI